MCLSNHITRGSAIVVRHDHQESINLPQLRPRITISAVYHTCKLMQQFWSYSCLRQLRYCTEIISKSLNMRQFQIFVHICLLNICTNNFANRSCWSEELHNSVLAFVSHSGKYNVSQYFHVVETRVRLKIGANFDVAGKPRPAFLITIHWSNCNIRNG